MVECRICLIEFGKEREPLLLLCGHSLCGVCVQELNYNEQNGLLCPTCRELTPGGLKLKRNYTLMEVIETEAKDGQRREKILEEETKRHDEPRVELVAGPLMNADNTPRDETGLDSSKADAKQYARISTMLRYSVPTTLLMEGVPLALLSWFTNRTRSGS